MNPDPLKHIDAHTHLNFDQLDSDRDKVIDSMKEQGIGAINIGIDEKTSRESIELAEEHEHIWASVGCHPTEATEDFRAKPYQTLTEQSYHAVAVGECGLDYSRSEYRSSKQKNIQEDVFVAQIKLAAEKDLPLILHIRPQENSMDAYRDALDILNHFQRQSGSSLSGTAHFFVGDKKVAKEFLDLGFHISFTGPITFDNRLQKVCSYIPTDRLLAETDSPFAAPEPHRGDRNSPLYLPSIVEAIADSKEDPQDAVMQQLCTNTQHVFALTLK